MKTLTTSLARLFLLFGFLLTVLLFAAPGVSAQTPENPRQGAIGLEGKVPADPPARGATISFPSNGQTFTETPIDVRGLCPNGVLVKLFKNDVFSGSALCRNGSYSITTDLFIGQNTLIARVVDDLDQAGPDSNSVRVTYRSSDTTEDEQMVLTTNFARKGAGPGQTLKWPLGVSGGTPPYAIGIDWGDGKTELKSLKFGGEFTIEHTFDKPGVYRIIVKITDANGKTSYIQLVGVANGPLTGSTAENPNGGADVTETREVRTVVLWPIIVMFALVVLTFWIGRRYELHKIKRIIESENPF